MFNRVGLKNTILGAGLIAAVACNLHAQTGATVITGVVTDSATHAPIAGAVVTPLSNTDLAEATDANGAFTIVIDPGVGIRAGARSDRSVGFAGNELSFSTGRGGARVRVTLHNLRGSNLATLQDAALPEGAYALSAVPASLPAGLYLVRAEVGNLVRSFKMSTLGGAGSRNLGLRRTASPAAARLAKKAEDIIDYISVSKTGYLRRVKSITSYADPQAVALDMSKAATTPMKIFSDSNMPQIDWANAAIYSWESTALLSTDSANNGFHGSVASMKDSSYETATWNGWAFHVAVGTNRLQPTVDLTPYAEGSLHLAVKGNAKTIGVMVSSPNQGAGSAPLVDLGAKGYLPDSAWHEIIIPMSEFAGTLDLSQVFVYCGFVSPSVQFGDFDPLATYMVDDIYYIPKP